MAATITRYTFGSNPSLVPLDEGGEGAPEALIRDAGFNPEDDELAISRLTADWQGHPAGSLVICTLTQSGYPFAVIEGA